MHLSGLGNNLIIPSWQKSGPCIHNHSQTVIFTSPFILQSVTCQILLQWSEMHYSVLSLSSAMMYMAHFHHDRIFKLVPRWGECIKILGGYDDKWWYFGGISDLHQNLWWLLIGSQEQWSVIYRTFLVDFKYISLQWFKFHLFCVIGCGYIRGWIGPVHRSLIIHSLSHSFLFSDGRFKTISLRGANTVSSFRGRETMW